MTNDHSHNILHVYSNARKKDQRETLRAFKMIDSVYQVEHIHAVKKGDYARAIKRFWGKGHDLIIVEQDIVPTPKQIHELLSCKARLCCFPYLIKADIPGYYSIFNFARYPRSDNWLTFDGAKHIGSIQIEKRPDYCGLSGFGLTKIGSKAQEMLDFPTLYNLGRWDIIDSWMSLRYYELIGRNRVFHVHYPLVKHNHFSSAKHTRKIHDSKILVF